jgi:ribosome-associated heat shock protein Hsp15
MDNGRSPLANRGHYARDQLEITIAPPRRTVIVRGVAERRVSPPAAANLYEETEQSVAERERQVELRRLGGPVDLGGRPTKRDRRRYDAGRRARDT